MSEIYVDYGTTRVVIGEAALDEASSGLLMGDYDFKLPPSEATNPQIVPLAQALKDPDFPPASSTKPKRLDGWTDQEIIDAGVTAARHLREDAMKAGEIDPVLVTKDTMRKMYALSLIPSPSLIINRFGRWSDYKQQIDGGISPTTRSRFRTWSDKQWKNYAAKVDGDLDHHPPKATDYVAADAERGGPSMYIIHRVFGTHGELNELIGYPNTLAWERPEMLQWGAKVAEVNGVERITGRLVAELSKRGYGPSVDAIEKFFPLGIPDFRNAIKAGFRQNNDTADQPDTGGILSPADYADKLSVTNDELGIVGRHGYSKEPWANTADSSSIGDISDAIRMISDTLLGGVEAVQTGELTLTDAQVLLAQATEGSCAPDVDEAGQLFNMAHQRLLELQHDLGVIVTKLSTINEQL